MADTPDEPTPETPTPPPPPPPPPQNSENQQLVAMGQAFTGLPMRSLIGGPLMAATEANAQMAMTQTKYILDTGFNKTGTGDSVKYEPIMVTMKLTKPIEIPREGTSQPTIKEGTTEVQVPLITLMPVPSLAVDSVDIIFDMEVKSSYSDTSAESSKKSLGSSGSFDAKYNLGFFSVNVKGSVSYSQSSSQSDTTTHKASNDAHYHVEVTAKQQPMPKGLALILKAFADNIGPTAEATSKSS